MKKRERQLVKENQAFTAAVRVYVAALTVAAAAIAFVAFREFGVAHRVPFATMGSLLVLMTVAVSMVLRFQYRGQVMALDLFEAMLAPAMFAFSPVLVIGMAAVSTVAAQIFLRPRPIKALFNVAQWTFASGLAVIVFHELRHSRGVTWDSAAALVVAITVSALANCLALTFVIALAERQPVAKVFAGLVPTLLVGWGVNTSFGLLFVASYRSNPFIVCLFVVPLAVLRWSHRSYAAVLADKARLNGMHHATRALAGPINPRDAIPNFLDEVCKCFSAEMAEVVLRESDGYTIYRSGPSGSTTVKLPDASRTLPGALMKRGRVTRLTRRTDAPALVELLALEGHRDCIAAPLIKDSTVIGVVCAYDCSGPEGFEDGELAVLETLAREASNAIAKAGMLEEIVDGRRKLSEIVEHTSDGILTMGADGSIQIWNRGMERITGYPASDVVGERAIDRLRPRDENGTDVMIERWADGLEIPDDLQILTRDGETCWLACSTTPVADSDERPHVLIMVVRDVTKAHEVERLKDDFVATVSHELRTPLTPIKGFAATLVDSGDLLSAKDRATAARSILNQAEHLERLVVNLLEVAKLERGVGGNLHDELVDIRSVAQRVAQDFRGTHPDRAIILEAPEDVRALGDELFIGQIIANLVSNAIKYSPAEEAIEIRMSCESEGAVTVSVVDHGPGIPSNEVERIFERFHRLGNVLTRATGGTGLGLYIARQLAASVGGTLNVESTLGEGSTFTLRLRPARRLVAVS